MLPAKPSGAAADGCDVLYVGRAEPPELHELETAGLRVARAPTFVAALERLPTSPAKVVLVHAEALGPDEARRFEALRRAGARAVVGVYPPELAWRADRAPAGGADAAIALPAAPGLLAAAARRLAGVTPEPSSSAELAAPGAAAGDRAGLQATSADAFDAQWLETVVADVATMNRALDDLDRLLDRVLESFVRTSHAERCSVLLYDRRRGDLQMRRTTLRGGIDGAVRNVPASGLAGHVARTGRTVLVSDVAAPPSEVREMIPRPDREERGYRTRSCLVLPLRGAEDVVGVVCLADRIGTEPFLESEVAPLEFLATQAGQAIENGLRFRQLQQLAAIDELTGLANRRQFQTALEREVQRARRYDRQLTLCLLDLDHFKQYNDLCGHQAGDAALAGVGEILRTSLRDADVVARYGGEEFALILPETAARPAPGARTPFPFLERVRRKIEEMPFPGEEKIPGGKLTVSGGVACFPDDATTLDDLVREADRALYVSKARGRNTITYRGKTLQE